MRRIARVLVPVSILVSLAGIGPHAKQAGQIRLDEPVTVGGTLITQGTCKVRWETNGSKAHVTFHRAGEVVAEAEARLVRLDAPVTRDRVTLGGSGSSGGGIAELRELRFRRAEQAFRFD